MRALRQLALTHGESARAVPTGIPRPHQIVFAHSSKKGNSCWASPRERGRLLGTASESEGLARGAIQAFRAAERARAPPQDSGRCRRMRRAGGSGPLQDGFARDRAGPSNSEAPPAT